MSVLMTAAQIAQAVNGELHGMEADTLIEGPVVIDSRQAIEGSVFVAIVGEKVDGHDYATATAGEVGTVLVIAQRPVDAPHILVDDCVLALGRLATVHLESLRANGEITVLGMTGSVGKTTTKDLTRQLAEVLGNTVAPRLSFNNEIGLPLTVLEADASTRYLVLEMGASGPGHIDELTAIAPLDIACVLMVGHAHMGGFGSIEAVARAKAEIIDGLYPEGLAILNADDERSVAMADRAPASVVTFSASGNPEATVRAINVALNERGCATFTLSCEEGQYPVELKFPGIHNVSNALAAMTMAMNLGMSAEQAAQVMSEATILSPHRMDVRELACGALIVDDSYNANLDSMTASLACLPTLAGTRHKVVIASAMLELGESSDDVHERCGKKAAEVGTDLLITIGNLATPMSRAAREAGVEVLHYENVEQLLEQLDSLVEAGDCVLIKGSHGSGAWRVADRLLQESVA